jgi:hypothetical protein
MLARASMTNNSYALHFLLEIIRRPLALFGVTPSFLDLDFLPVRGGVTATAIFWRCVKVTDRRTAVD